MISIVNGVQKIGADVLLIVNNYILGVIWGNDFIFLYDSHNNDESGNLSSSGIAILLNFAILPTSTFYKISLLQYFPSDFVVQFVKVYCTVNAKNAILNMN